MLANGQMIASLLLWLATVVAGAPDATRTSPVPEWAARFDEFMGLLDARGVTFIEGGRDALYLEAGRRWLCIWRETSGLRCYAWTGNAPRIRSFGIFSHDDQTRLPTETDDHLFDLRVDAPGADGQLLSVRRVKCASARDELAYSMPPSRRPKARPRRCSRETLVVGTRLAATTDETPLTVARAFAGMRPESEKMDELMITAVEHAGAGLVSVGEGSDQGGFSQLWTCHRAPGLRRSCGATTLSKFRAIQPEATLPGGWLVLASSPYNRSGSSSLVWVGRGEFGLTSAELRIGATSAYGEGCEHLPGYCVDVEGDWTPYEILSSTCVKIESTVHWKATHVRAQNRWIREKIFHKPRSEDESLGEVPAPGTYRPGLEGWKAADCARESERR